MNMKNFKQTLAFILVLLLTLADPVAVFAENGSISGATSFVRKTGFYVVSDESLDSDVSTDSDKGETALVESDALAGGFLPEAETMSEAQPSCSLSAAPAAATSSQVKGPVLKSGSEWIPDTVNRTQIGYITFKNGAMDQVPADHWNMDEEDTGSVVGYVRASEGIVTLFVHTATYSQVRANEDASDMFKGFTNMGRIIHLEMLDTSETTDMSGMFADCSSLESLDLSGFDTSKVVSADGFMENDYHVSSISLGAKWVKGKCLLVEPSLKSTDGYWYNSTSEERYKPADIPSGAASYVTKNVYKVSFETQMAGTATPSDQFVSVGGLITEPKTALIDPAGRKMFIGWYKEAKCLEAWDFANDKMPAKEVVLYGAWETPSFKLRAVEGWFNGAKCTKSQIERIVFTETDPQIKGAISWYADERRNGGIVCFATGSDVYVMANVGAYQGERIHASEESSRMFAGFTNLKEIVGLELVDFSTAERMSGLFAECASLTSLESGQDGICFDKIDTSHVVDMSRMFEGCSALEKVNLSQLKVASCSDMSHMFANCVSLQTVDFGTLPNEGADSVSLKDISCMFRGCSALKSVFFGKLNIRSVTNMWGLFYQCRVLEQVDFEDAYAEKAENLNYLFQDCLNLKQLDLSGLGLGSVKTAQEMFGRCEALETLNLSGIEMPLVESTKGMFSVCKSLKMLDITSMKTQNVKDMTSMFCQMESLEELDLTNFDTSSVERGKAAGFTDGCQSLAVVKLGTGWTGSVTLAAPNTNTTDGLWYRNGVGYKPSKITEAGTYERVISKYPVTFNSNGHGRTLSKAYYQDGALIKTPASIYEDGYTMKGWYKDPELSEKWNFASDKMKKPGIELYASWTVNHYSVKFDKNGGEGTMDAMPDLTYGQTYAFPQRKFKRTGYRFVEWNTEKGGKGKKYPESGNFENLSKNDGATVTLYAIWEPIKYSIRFDGNGADSGEMATVSNVTYGKSVELPNNHFKKEGHSFISWNTEKNGSGLSYVNGQKVKNLSYEEGKVVTLYAQWQKKVLTDDKKKEPEEKKPEETKQNQPVGNTGDSGSSGGSVGSGSSGSSGGSVGSGSSGSSGGSGGSGSSGGGLSGSSGGSVGSAGPGAGAGAAAGTVGAAGTASLPAYVEKDGTWQCAVDGNWSYTRSSGVQVRDEWVCVYNPYAAQGSPNYSWFRFDPTGQMAVGWYTDPKGDVYYLNAASDGSKGKMLTGWQFINDSWYYFNEVEGSGTMGALVKGAVRNF